MKAEVVADGKSKIEEIPADLKAAADEWRTKLTEQVAETDDALIEKYLEGGQISQAE